MTFGVPPRASAMVTTYALTSTDAAALTFAPFASVTITVKSWRPGFFTSNGSAAAAPVAAPDQVYLYGAVPPVTAALSVTVSPSFGAGRSTDTVASSVAASAGVVHAYTYE